MLRVLGKVRLLPSVDSEELDRIQVYISKHLPTSNYVSFNIYGCFGSFEIQTDLTTAHRYGMKSRKDPSKIAIPEDTFLGFDIMGVKYKDSNQGDTKDDVPIGNEHLGCSQINLSSCWRILQAFNKNQLHWKDLYPTIPVTDEYSLRTVFDMGNLEVLELEITLSGACFEGTTYNNNHWETPQSNPPNEIIRAENICKAFIQNSNNQSASDSVSKMISKKYDMYDEDVLKIANDSIKIGFQRSEYPNPTISILSTVHCPYYKQSRNMQVGPAYAMSMPNELSDESFYEECIRRALARYSVKESWFCNIVEKQMSTASMDRLVNGFALAYALAGSALTVYVNSRYYTEDVDMIPTESRFGDVKAPKILKAESSDRYTDLRKLGTDDCEGMAKEIVMEHRELVSGMEAGMWHSNVVKAYAKCLRWSIPMMVHGIAKTGNTEKKGMYYRTAAVSDETVSISPLSKHTDYPDVLEAPSYLSKNTQDQVTSVYNEDLERESFIKVIESETNDDEQSVASAHCFVILENPASFLKRLHNTKDGSKFQSTNTGLNPPFSLDPLLFSQIPPWVDRLPYLILEGTNYVFPLQIPLGLLYEPGSHERKRISIFHKKTRKTLRYLQWIHPEIFSLSSVRYGMGTSTTRELSIKETWNNASNDFYMMIVAGYVPTVCPYVEPNSYYPTSPSSDDLRTAPRLRPTVMREVAFVQPNKKRFGVLVADIITNRDQDVISYSPTLCWNPDISDLVEHQALVEAPIPPIKRNPDREIMETRSRIASKLENDLLALLQESGNWIPLKRIYSNYRSSHKSVVNDTKETSLDTEEGIPSGSYFDYDSKAGIKINFHLPEDIVIRGKAFDILKKVVSDKRCMIRDVWVTPVNLGSPMNQTKENGNGSYSYDITLQVKGK